MDPLGLALEHFDRDSAYRIKDNGQPVDSTGEWYKTERRWTGPMDCGRRS